MRKDDLNLIIVFLATLLLGVHLWAGHLFAAAITDLPTIEADELKKLLYEGPPMVCANALSSIEFKDMTIRGSVNIPSSKVKGHPNLPKKKDELLVFFCKGVPG